jgi:hypothetical protein
MQAVPTSHPLEQVFDLEANSTQRSLVTPTPVETLPAIVTAQYDQKDSSIDTELAAVHAEAMAVANEMKSQMAFADPRGLPRMGEVAIQALNTALDAIKQKADIKKHKDKLAASGGIDSVNNVTNNTLIIDRSALLDKIMAGEL